LIDGFPIFVDPSLAVIDVEHPHFQQDP